MSAYVRVVRHAVAVTGFGSYAAAGVVATIASTAEASGWDGLFIWDHLGWVEGIPCGDPWISMTAAAAVTSRLRLGFDVTPLPRRRPQVVATAATALDRFSDGRLTLGVGLGGVAREFEGNVTDEHGRTVIEPAELRQRLDQVGRTDDEFDVAVTGESEAGDASRRNEYERAGATWWLECIHDLRGPLEAMLDRVRQGP